MCAETSNVTPLVLLPGMGADRRLFDAQARALDRLIPLDWIEPETANDCLHRQRERSE